MGVASKAGDWAFKAFTAGLGVTTIYLTTTFSVNVYRGISWHNSQSPVRLLLMVSVSAGVVIVVGKSTIKVLMRKHNDFNQQSGFEVPTYNIYVSCV
ncbi:hypothetical protein TorRG33x02_181520 [Trema orientale]|uniref:Uncharacterized protein n=1 Tax=Trema orientale TaxID=63057 RepID=A0A2P5EKR8_TREOI|nr:hypothetical protein TorRG33x02_181520 [Trema orientale]